MLLLALTLLLLGCKDPFDFEPHDPSLPNPPGPPILVYPEDGKKFKYDTPYPRDVTLKWNAVPGAEFYQVEIYRDSVLTEPNLYVPLINYVYAAQVTVSFRTYGFYYWRVRADSPRRWNALTDWSGVWVFALPNPTD